MRLLILVCNVIAAIPILNSSVAYPVTTAAIQPWLRVTDGPHHLKIDNKGRHIAFTGENGVGLRMVDLTTKQIVEISKQPVGPSYFWAPDSFRVFYREIYSEGKAITSVLKAYDLALHKSVTLDRWNERTGHLSFDPLNLRVYLASASGIRTKSLSYPDDRLARWQMAQRNDEGRWIAGAKGMLWLSAGGLKLESVSPTSEEQTLETFAISPDGRAAAWSTEQGQVYASLTGNPAIYIGPGRQPSWHPEKPLLVFAAARQVGSFVRDFDLAVSDLHGRMRHLTSTRDSQESWPIWHPNGRDVIFTKVKSTDFYLMPVAP